MYKTGTIINRDTMFIYFEMIKQTGAKSILDAGMFLKRIGAVARQAVDCEISAQACICGVDFFPEADLPIYEMIYDQILSLNQFMDCTEPFTEMEGKQFDVAFMLEVFSMLREPQLEKFAAYFLQKASGIVADTQMGDWLTGRGLVRGYYPLMMEHSRFAWIPVDELRI